MQTLWQKHIASIPKVVTGLKPDNNRPTRNRYFGRGEATTTTKKFLSTWRNVVQRSTNPIDKRYNYYHKFEFYQPWLTFENFRNDMFESFLEHAAKYGLKETTIDRIDNAKGYSPSNCRWATWEEQRKNRKRKPKIEKSCKGCGITFLTKKSDQTFCTRMCFTNFHTLPEGTDRRLHDNERRKVKYRTDPSTRTRLRIASRKWLEKVKHTKEYKEKQKSISKRWLAKKKLDPAWVAKKRVDYRANYQKLKNDPVKYARQLANFRAYYHRNKEK